MNSDEVPLAVPYLGGNEWKYLKECLDTNFVSSVGPFVTRFERDFAACVGTDYAVATSSGTAALHVALLLANVQPDDEVLVSALSFIAPANAVRYCGAWPVFIDADPVYWQMDAQRVADFLTRCCDWRDGVVRNRSTGRRVSAILPVHVLGHSVDLDPILELAQRFGLAVVEDATEGLGASYNGRPTGTFGRLGCFSFNGNKLLTTGGGGMIVTGDKVLAARAKYLTTQAKDDPIEFIHGAVGFNYRLTNIQAALGCAQLERLEDHVAWKRRIAATYHAAFSGVHGIRLMREAPWMSSAYWMYTILIDPEQFGMDRRELWRVLDEQGIQTRPLWQPLHQSPAHIQEPAAECPVAEDLHRSALSLPCSVGLTDVDQRRVIDAVLRARGSR